MKLKFLSVTLVVIVIVIVVVLQAMKKNNVSAPKFEDFDLNNFDEHSININNEWSPLIPGTQWVYEGTTKEDGKEIAHRVVFTVTDLTKVINGVSNVVAWDTDLAADSLVETELAFYAQDKDGNVWHFGQYPEEYEEGKLVAAPAWIAGLEDAKAGISMMRNPQPGTKSYSQGWGPRVNWTDRAKVVEVGKKNCVPFGCYENTLTIEETAQKEPGAFQLKYYAQNIGNIAVGWKGKDATQETLKLVDFKKLSLEDMDKVRTEALELEKRAYEISKDVYGHTQPAKQTFNKP